MKLYFSNLFYTIYLIFEAKVAAERIIHYLIHECKNCSYSNCSDCSLGPEKKENISSNTSDYYSNSPSIVEENVHNLSNDTLSFENVFLSFIQRNQSLILKYLYSIICLDFSVPSKRKNALENISDSSTVNKAWNLPHSACKSKNYLCLEEKYWVCFWEKVFTFCLKLVLEVPCHQYGNAAAGVLLLWPHSYHSIMFKLLKSAAENKDISFHASNVLKKLFHHLLVLTTEAYWDKNMSLTLPLIHNQHYMPIPAAGNKARTQAGNALCSCLESLGIPFLSDFSTARHPFYKVLYSFQVTFDYFIFFTDIRTRSSVSSADLNTFMLISFSDCEHALKLLKERRFTSIFDQCGHFKCTFSSNNLRTYLSNQIEVLSGHISDAPFVIHRIIFYAVRSTYKNKVKTNLSCIFNHDYLFEMERSSFSSIDEVLSSFVDILPHIYGGINMLSVMISATASSLLSILQIIRKNTSHKEIQALKEILLHVFKWLEVLEIEEYHREKLRGAKCLQKISCIIHILESSSSSSFKTKYFQRTGNKVSPLLIDIDLNERMILTEEEQLYWRTSCQRNYHPCL